MRRILLDIVFFLLPFLTGICRESNWTLFPSKIFIFSKKSSQSLFLGINQGIHRVNNDCPSLGLFRISAKNSVENGNKIGKGFSGPGAARYNEMFVVQSLFNRLLLMQI